MEKVENPTAIRVKNSFSIENILSRPDKSENQRKMMRQNPFENNHVLFYGSAISESENLTSDFVKSEEAKFIEHERSFDIADNEDHETNSEAASDDGNSSVHSEF